MPKKGEKRIKYNDSSILLLIPKEIKEQFAELCKRNHEEVSVRIREMIRRELEKDKDRTMIAK